MGAVWEALHLVTLKPVALKVLKPHGSDATSAQRFLREARAASAVRHPNVVKIHDVLEMEGSLFMVMDFLEGESLEEHLEREPKMPLGRASRVLGPVVEAVRAAHAVGIVHRDLKPANIFLVGPKGNDEPLVQVLDFGIAKMLSREGESEGGADRNKLTATGAVLGTPYYMAPEQAWGEAVDPRADIWSLGVVVYECLAGCRPFEGDSVGQLLKAIAIQSYIPLDEVDPNLPRTVTDLVRRMIKTDRNERLSDLSELSVELERYAQGERSVPRITITSSGRPEPVDALAATTDGGSGAPLTETFEAVESGPSREAGQRSPESSSIPRPPPRSPRSSWALGLLGVTLVAGVAGLYATRPSSPPAMAPQPTPPVLTTPTSSSSDSAATQDASPSLEHLPTPSSTPTESVHVPQRSPSKPTKTPTPTTSVPAPQSSAAPKPSAAPSSAGGLHLPPPF